MDHFDDKPAARDFRKVAADHPSLSRTLRLARTYADLNERVLASLPDSAHGRIRIACVEDDCLVIAATTPAWASRARMLAEDLLDAAAALWPTALTRTRVIVVPEEAF